MKRPSSFIKFVKRRYYVINVSDWIQRNWALRIGMFSYMLSYTGFKSIDS